MHDTACSITFRKAHIKLSSWESAFKTNAFLPAVVTVAQLLLHIAYCHLLEDSLLHTCYHYNHGLT